MKHLPGDTLTEQEALDWGKYVGIDCDGTARVFKHKPVRAGNTWIPDKFPGKMFPACYRIEVTYQPHLHGRLLKREREDGETFFRPVAEE